MSLLVQMDHVTFSSSSSSTYSENNIRMGGEKKEKIPEKTF